MTDETKHSIDDNEMANLSFFGQVYNRFIIEDSYRNQLLNHLEQDSVPHYGFVFNDNHRINENIKHLDSGSYAHVYRLFEPNKMLKFEHKNHIRNPVIIKMIPLLAEELLQRLTDFHRISSYNDVHNECIIQRTLSQLNGRYQHSDGRIYMCTTFPRLFRSTLIRGPLGSCFDVQTNNNDDDDNVDDNEEGLPFMNNVSDEFNLTDQIPQEYMMLVMEDCGLPITDCLQQIKPLACVSIVKQLIIGLMIAETVFQFEHRDLHGGNVLVQTTNKTMIHYIMRNRTFSLPSYGCMIKIIDTTFSRIRIGQTVYHKQLSYLFTSDNLSSSKSEQDRTYERMNQLVTSNDQHWKQYHPQTNVIWIEYIIGKILRLLTPVDGQLAVESNSNNVKSRTATTNHVIRLLTNYTKLTDNCSSATELFDKIVAVANRNNDDLCRIRFH